MSKIRIIHLLQSSKFSGAENVVCQIIELFKANDVFEMFYVSPRGQIESVLKQRGIHYYMLNEFSQKEIDRAVETINPTIIHAHDFNASVHAVKYRQCSIISHLHNNPLWLSKIDPRTIAYSLSIRKYYKIIGVSKSVRDEFRYKKLLNNKFIMLPNVVDEARVTELGEEKAEGSDILYVGRMSPEKNPLAAVEIVEMVSKRYSDRLHVIMIGEGPMMDEVKNIVKKKGLSSIIEFKGFENNPYKYMKNSKVLLMPSLWEGFGLVAIESMLLGTPVVASPVGGLKDIIDNTNGYLCNSLEEMTSSIIELLTSEDLRKEKGKSAVMKARKFSDTVVYKEVLEKIYLSALSR